MIVGWPRVINHVFSFPRGEEGGSLSKWRSGDGFVR